MMRIVLSIVARLLAPTADVELVHRLEPSADAAQHVELARDAAELVGVEWHLLLAIAWHETRLHLAHVQVEADGRLSCGVGTAEPVATRAECDAYIAGGYVALARHLRGWLDARDHVTLRPLSRHDALVGFAGGYHLIDLCRAGPVVIRRGVDACLTPEVFDGIASSITTAPKRRVGPTRRRPSS